jgi:hypothetical protein
MVDGRWYITPDIYQVRYRPVKGAPAARLPIRKCQAPSSPTWSEGVGTPTPLKPEVSAEGAGFEPRAGTTRVLFKIDGEVSLDAVKGRPEPAGGWGILSGVPAHGAQCRVQMGYRKVCRGPKSVARLADIRATAERSSATILGHGPALVA